MRQRIHQQKQHEHNQKLKTKELEQKEVMLKIKAFEEENNEMWNEIKLMNEAIPDKNIIPETMNVMERKEFN